ncbi:MAG: hypothetical protein ABJA70_04910 [Chryseolinea sp.]
MSSKKNNKGFDPNTIKEYSSRIEASGKKFVLDHDDERTDEYAHFYFVGLYEDKEVIYDTAIYTLRLHHESELYEEAEQRAAKQFPQYKKLSYDQSDKGNSENSDELEEEVGLFMAEVILELEEEETIKVKEHVDQDLSADFGISLDVGLNRDKISDTVISKFVLDFNSDTISLDDTLYSFLSQDQETD